MKKNASLQPLIFLVESSAQSAFRHLRMPTIYSIGRRSNDFKRCKVTGFPTQAFGNDTVF